MSVKNNFMVQIEIKQYCSHLFVCLQDPETHHNVKVLFNSVKFATTLFCAVF
jgi:hypothetical protein